jgi:asparagine synthase (glutamine-hydrolysing)
MGPAMLDSGLFAPDAIGQVLDEHTTGRFDHADLLWLLLVFQGFLETVVPGAPALDSMAEAVAT